MAAPSPGCARSHGRNFAHAERILRIFEEVNRSRLKDEADLPAPLFMRALGRRLEGHASGTVMTLGWSNQLIVDKCLAQASETPLSAFSSPGMIAQV
jgi:hypothetical protein